MEKFKYKKSLGQNFLQNENIIKKMIDNVSITPNDLIVEIGPGHGVLTKALKTFQANIICYEIDEDTKSKLSILEDEKTQIIFNDFLKVDILSDIKNIQYEKLYIIANIPYYITTPIIEKIINLNLPVTEVILMVQNEVADRISAKPRTKAYGSLTVYLNYYFDIEKLFIVKKEDFYPVPNVNSAVIRLRKKTENNHPNNKKYFFELINDAFRQKRKTIKNNLLNYDLATIEKILLKNGLTLKSRAEEISLSVFVELSNALTSQK